MATLAQIQTTVNTRLATLWPKVKTREEARFAAVGRYWQGLLWATPPDDGATCVPNLSLVAGPQNTSWNSAVNGDVNATESMAVRIDTYEAPGGVHGYFCTCIVTKNGLTYARTAQVEMGVEITTGSWAQV